MKLSHNSIAKLVHGALRIEKLDRGYTGFYRFSTGQVELLKNKRDAFLYERTSLSSGVTLEFITDAKLVQQRLYVYTDVLLSDGDILRRYNLNKN